MQARSAHHEVLARGRAVLHLDATRGPTELWRDDVTAAHPHVLALAQGLDTVEVAVLDCDATAVPEGRATELGHLDVAQREGMVVPKRVAQVHERVVNAHVRALLEGTLAVSRPVEATVPHDEVMLAVERALLVKGLILDGLPVHAFLLVAQALLNEHSDRFPEMTPLPLQPECAVYPGDSFA